MTRRPPRRSSEQAAIITNAARLAANLDRHGAAVWSQLVALADARARGETHGQPDAGSQPKGGHSDRTAGAALAGTANPLEDPDRYVNLLAQLDAVLDQLHHVVEWNKPRPRPTTDASTAWCENPTCPGDQPVKKDTTRAGICQPCRRFKKKHGRTRTRSDITPEAQRLARQWDQHNTERNTAHAGEKRRTQ